MKKEKSMQINVTGIVNSKKMLIDSNGIDLENWEEAIEKKGEVSNLENFTNKIIDLNFANSVFVDCSASKNVVEFYEKLLKKSISIASYKRTTMHKNYNWTKCSRCITHRCINIHQ